MEACSTSAKYHSNWVTWHGKRWIHYEAVTSSNTGNTVWMTMFLYCSTKGSIVSCVVPLKTFTQKNKEQFSAVTKNHLFTNFCFPRKPDCWVARNIAQNFASIGSRNPSEKHVTITVTVSVTFTHIHNLYISQSVSLCLISTCSDGSGGFNIACTRHCKW
jgi:hypothetical protein